MKTYKVKGRYEKINKYERGLVQKFEVLKLCRLQEVL